MKYISNSSSDFCIKISLRIQLQPFLDFKKTVFHALLPTPLNKKNMCTQPYALGKYGKYLTSVCLNCSFRVNN